MVFEKILGNIHETEHAGKELDFVTIDWYDTRKRIHRMNSESGRDVKIRLNDETRERGLRDGDILSMDEATGEILYVKIPAEEVIVADIERIGMLTKVCYEIGNRHSPLYYGDNDRQLLIPHDGPMFEMLEKLGAKPRIEKRTLKEEKAISSKATASGHSHSHGEDDCNPNTINHTHTHGEEGHSHEHPHEHSHGHAHN